MRKPEIFLSLEPKCISCGAFSNEIRLQTFRGGKFGVGKVIPFVACPLCFTDKEAIMRKILSLGLHEKDYPGGLREDHIELKN